MSDERSQFAQKIDERTFSPSRRGYDKTEVKEYLEDVEQAFRELEGHSRRLSQKVAELEQEVSKARATEKVSVDNAMMAVFDAKDRILERARRKASEIEEEARLEASRIREAAIAEGGGAGASGELAAARAQADEIIAGARREADRLRNEVAAAATDGLESELADMGERLRRAHDESAAIRAELDAARKRIVELEGSRPQDDTAELKQKFAELEGLVSTTRADADRLQRALDQAQEEREAALLQVTEAESVRYDLQAKLGTALAELDRARTAAAAAAADHEALQAEFNAAQERVAELSEAEELRREADQLRRDADRLRTEAEARLAELEARAAGAEGRAAEAEETAAEAKAQLEASRIQQEAIDDASGPELEQTAFAGSMVAFEARTNETLTRNEGLGLIAETVRAAGQIPAESPGTTDEAQADAERIIAEARQEAEAIMAEAEEHADQRAAKVIARAREEADQVRETVATLTAQADDARSAALRSKLEAEDLAEAQKAMSEARDQIITTAERRAEEITQDAEKAAANLRSEADTALQEAHAEAERILAAAVDRAHEHETADTHQAATDVGPEPAAAQADAPPAAAADLEDTPPSESGDELATLLAEAERDLIATEKLRRERERLDAQEAELAAQRAEAILLAAARDGAAPDLAASDAQDDEAKAELPVLEPETDGALIPVESAVHGEPVSLDGDPSGIDAAVDAPAPRIEFNDILDMEDAGRHDLLPSDEDDDEEDPADLLTALLEEVAPMEDVDEDDALAMSEGTELGDAEVDDSPAPRETVADPADEPRPRVAWPSPVDVDRELEKGVDRASRESRYRSRSAQLPRLGKQAKSNMTTMANLRKKRRGADDD